MVYCAYCGTEVMAANGMPCPSCSNPKNGAPKAAPVVVKSLSKGAIVLIVAAIALPFIVAVIGIMSAIAIPNLLTAMQRSKQKRTMADIRSVASAIEAYNVDHKTFPSGNDSSALEAALVPQYIRVMPRIDGWGHTWRYECVPREGMQTCQSYAFGSGGKDGAFQLDSLSSYKPETATTNFDCDIIFANGAFVQYPEGLIQRQ
jgi:type II secretory pathway pseudopilin PulG